MKKKARYNWMAPSTRQIFATSLVFLQIVNLISTQANIEPLDNSQLRGGLREIRALKLSQGEAECSQCNKMSEMPMDLADKINDVDDVDVFIHDFVFEGDTNSLSNMSSLVQHPADRKRRAAREQLRQATCKPIDTIVSLVPPNENDPTLFYFPSCVLIKQCGGCCAHTGTSCTPTDESETQVTIKKTKFTGGSKLQAMGEITVTVKEHNRCKCQCKKTASDCNSLQKFIANQCRCECSNIHEAEECAKDPTKLFDPKNCACVCRDERDCPTGLDFDHRSCSCQPKTDDGETNDFLDFGEHTYHETYEATDDTKYDTAQAATE